MTARQRKIVMPGETREAILDRLYRAQNLFDRLDEAPEDVADLDSSAWEALYEVLFCRRRVPPHYRVREIDILKVLDISRRWAHAVAHPPLEFWIGTVAWHWTNGLPAVQHAAGGCLPALQARLKRKDEDLTLLRAADPPGMTGELLRPSAGVTDTDASTLLRARDEDDE